MAPPSGRACIRRARAATRAQASSRERTPAAWAAPMPPTEWPRSTPGRTPQDRISRYSAVSRANRAGWVQPVSYRAAAPGVPSSANMTSLREPCGVPEGASTRSGSRRATTSSRASAKTGWRSYSSRPVPGRWLPWPVKSRAVRPVPPVSPRTSAGSGRSAARAARARRASSAVPTTTARCSKAGRVVASEKVTSAGASPGRASRWASSRAAWARSAGRVRPERVQGRTVGSAGAAGADSAEADSPCSRTMCALVPLMPKEETPARRGRPVSGQAAGSWRRRTSPVSQSTWREGLPACRVRGSSPWLIAMTILMTPATPAAAWVWPMLDFTEPSSNGRSSGRSWPYVARRAWASMGSPRAVPVPCASTASTSAVVRPAVSRAWRMTRCWEGPLGAVSPLEAPSWLTADPRTTARTRWPLRRASESRSRTSMPTPSDQPTPSASSENALQRPSGDRPRWRENSMREVGVDITVTPPARASEHSPERRACIAQCMATREEEQAVSTVTAGPSRPRA
ncbi:hypothetical protein EES44_14785 [Streptomyces sp. ADI96-15]|nr:hypothetical protein EES44_14785 [Streptomyces sp. ADI96-15]